MSVKIFDAPITESNRVLLAEIEDISGENTIITTKTLNESYKQKTKNDSRLKRVFVDYEIPSVSTADNKNPDISDRGAIILVLGYKN